MIALADKITKSFGGRVLYSAATLQLNAGERWALVGPNGAGKTTLLKIIMGQESPDEGTISFAKDTSIGYLEQEAKLAGEKTALQEVVDSAVEIRRLADRNKELERQISQTAPGQELDRLLEQYGKAQDRFERLGGYELEARAREILAGLGFPVEDFDKPAKEFSGGWQMRISLSKLLLRHPDLLLLDEPTNHLDVKHQVELVDYLRDWCAGGQHTVIGVLHDVNLALHLSRMVLFMSEGRIVRAGDFTEIADAAFLNSVYGMDLSGFMRQSLALWRDIP